MKGKGRMYFIEQIGTGRKRERVLERSWIRIVLKKTPDDLCISSVKRRMSMKSLKRFGYIPWYGGWLPLGYNQEGIARVWPPHRFREFQRVHIRKRAGKIVSVVAAAEGDGK